MLALTAVAIFPLLCVSYVVVRDETGNVSRGIDSELQAAALSAQARISELLDRREVSAMAAATSARVQTALRRHEGRTLKAFARQQHVVLRVGGRRYGHPLSPALTARVQLVSGGRSIGSVETQLPLDATTLARAAVRASPGIRLSLAALPARAGTQSRPAFTLPVTKQTGVRAWLPHRLAAARRGAAYRRAEEAGLLALFALMVLTFALARPLLRALRWTEERAGEARVDALTGIANRRALEEALAAELSRASRFGHELAIVLLDLDHFKETNDLHGHAAGDLLLREVGGLLAATARQGDTVGRLGGEEFVAVLPETDLEGARLFAERLRLGVAARRIEGIRTSASCGVATLLPDDTVESLLAAADEALYRAKQSGRNRIESAVRASAFAAA